MAQVGMHEAKTQLSRLVERARSGEEIVIARNGRPVVRLVAIDDAPALASVRGAWKGRVTIPDDFDQLPEDVARGFGLD